MELGLLDRHPDLSLEEVYNFVRTLPAFRMFVVCRYLRAEADRKDFVLVDCDRSVMNDVPTGVSGDHCGVFDCGFQGRQSATHRRQRDTRASAPAMEFRAESRSSGVISEPLENFGQISVE